MPREVEGKHLEGTWQVETKIQIEVLDMDFGFVVDEVEDPKQVEGANL